LSWWTCELRCDESFIIRVNDYFYDNLLVAMSIFDENKFDYFYDNLYDNLLLIYYDLTFWQKEQMYMNKWY
jgi:hypothetical protein